MNKVILMGRLTRDPEIRYSQGERSTAVARYSLAVNRTFERDGEPDADFINCVAFGRQAEFAEKHFHKSIRILITGRIQTGSYTNKDGEERSLPELMNMDVNAALHYCRHMGSVRPKLEILRDLGLGYLTLGEETPSLSGGEAQRLKLASEMGRKQTDSVFVFDEPTIEFSYKNDELGDPLMNAYHAIALKAATREEIETIKAMAFKVNEVMKQYFDTLNVILVDFKLEFGKTADGKIVLADEISPDTCRLWDKTTKEKLDKDRFRRDMGGVEEAYQEIMKRVMGK